MKYVNTTRDFSLTFQKGKKTKINLMGSTDSDYATSLDVRKSNSAYVFKYINCTISWNSSKQKTVSLSSTEAEYKALTSAVKEAVWLKQLFVELSRKSEKINIYCDNNRKFVWLIIQNFIHAQNKLIDDIIILEKQ